MTDQYPVSTEGFGNETTGQYPSPGGNETTGQYPVSVDGMGNETTGQYPVPVDGMGNETTGQYPVPIEGSGNETTGQYSVPIDGMGNETGSTIPGTTASLADQAAETNNQLNTRSAELANAEELSSETDKVASTIDAITGSGATTPSSRMKRAGHEITTPTDCSSFLNMLKDFNAAIGNNPRKANVTKGLLIAKALTSVEKDSISCDAQEVSSLKVMKEVTVVSVKSIVKQVVNLKKIEINVLIAKIQEINNNLSNAGMSTVSVVVSTFAVSPTVPEPEEETNELGQTTTSFVETLSNETTDQYPVSTEGFGNETTGQYPSPGGNEATGQYPVPIEGAGNETTGQYPVPIEGSGNETTGQYPVPIEGAANETTGQYPIPVDGMGNETTGQYPVPIEGAGNETTGQYPVPVEGSGSETTGPYPV